MPRWSKKNLIFSFNHLDLLEDLAPPISASFFKSALKRYFEEKSFVESQKQLKKEIQPLKKTLKEMDDVKVAHQVMEQTKDRLQNAYQELLEKSNTN